PDFEARIRSVPLIDSTKVTVAMDGPLTITAGHTADHRLIVRNLDRNTLVLERTAESQRTSSIPSRVSSSECPSHSCCRSTGWPGPRDRGNELCFGMPPW